MDQLVEPRSFRPLARLEGGQLAYVVNDHLGTPKEVVSEGGTLLWAADHDTWGSLRPLRKVAGAGDEDYWLTLSSDDPTGSADPYDYPPPPSARSAFRASGKTRRRGSSRTGLGVMTLIH